MADLAQELSHRPPGRAAGPFGAGLAWVRANLFNTLLNSALTLVIAYTVLRAGFAILRWAAIDAAWFAPNGRACVAAADGDGPCRASIHERHRLILLGRYPYDEQRRPLAFAARRIGRRPAR